MNDFSVPAARERGDRSDSPAHPPAGHVPILDRMELIVAAAFALIALVLLVTPPSIGMADMGDFGRITHNIGLVPVHDPAK